MSETFYPMYRYPGYKISFNGQVCDESGNLVDSFISCGQLFYILGKYSYSAARLVWEAFIGEVSTYIHYADDNPTNVSITNLYVNLNLEYLDSENLTINGIPFRKIPGFRAYAISRGGTVYSFNRRQFIVKAFNHAGYPTVALVDDSGFRSPRKVHRLVYLTWIGPLEDDKVIDHIDNNILNSDYTNLQQISQHNNVLKYYHRKAIDEISFEDVADYSESELRTICECIAKQMPYGEILAAIGKENYTASDYSSMVNIVNLLRRRTAYADLANEFKLPYKAKFPGKHGKSGIFTDQDIQFIIGQYELGRSQQSLAKLYDCSQSMISTIVRQNKVMCNGEGSTTIERIA